MSRDAVSILTYISLLAGVNKRAKITIYKTEQNYRKLMLIFYIYILFLFCWWLCEFLSFIVSQIPRSDNDIVYKKMYRKNPKVLPKKFVLNRKNQIEL